MNIFKRIGLFFDVVYKFRPYFKNGENYLYFLKIVDVSFDKEIVEIYEKMCLLGKRSYKKDKAKYECLVNEIDEHNKEVKLINDAVESWNFDKVVANPVNNKQYVLECFDLVTKISKYKKLDSRYVLFVTQVENIKDKFDEMCLQFDFLKEFSSLINFEQYGYITREQKRNIVEIVNKKICNFKVFYYPEYDKIYNLNELINKHNEEYLYKLSNNPLFDNIGGRSLDKEQRLSVLNEEKSVLVVAGAGSGKTLTICGKVEYLLKEKGVNPNDILLLSYSKKSADDLQAKISKIDSKLTVGTFHKIGLDVLKETQHTSFAVEDQYKAIIEEFFREEVKNRPEDLRLILTYYGLYISDYDYQHKYETKGEYYQDLKNAQMETLKDQLINLSDNTYSLETIKKECVKSYEELAIANWYFINGIDYTYEAPYEIDLSSPEKRQYLPDFKIKKYNIYHEHYGVDKDGKANQYKGEEAVEYVETMRWKQNVHRQYHTTCLETYSYEFYDGTIFEKLERQLKEKGVEFHPLSDEEIYNAVNSIYESRPFKSLIILISTFLSLYKSTYKDESGFEILKSKSYYNNFEKRRASMFLDIVREVYRYYMGYLRKEGKIDFDDMILQAIDSLDKTQCFKYKYIIVDEFQDISISRMKFLKRLIQQGDSKLFAVGDDWQAIYRFSGCDLGIFLNFDEYFGDSAITRITTTHRNSQELQDIACPFIKKNPEQYDKTIHSERHLEHPVRICYYSEKKYHAFLDVLEEISKMNPTAHVLILGRNNKDFEDIEMDRRIYIDRKESDETTTVVKCSDYPHMKLTYSTVHSSKGLEEEYVILISADDGKTGFPNKMEDDPLLNLVLTSKSEFRYAEERRLWYVALTRTKTYTYIISNIKRPSEFVVEIKDQCVVMNPQLVDEERSNAIACPRCKSGRLVMRNDKDGKEFYGCSNYPYCTYSISDFMAVKRNKRCKDCGDYLVLRSGKWGRFFGCNSYPHCKYKEQVKEEK